MAEYKAFDENSYQLYTAELLKNILLGLHSICKGTESKFFNGHTNITDSSFDEFYLFLTNLTAVEYVHNFSKRMRKKDSAVIIASQNLEDFNIEGIRKYIKSLFSIPTHQFLFNAGNIDAKFKGG